MLAVIKTGGKQYTVREKDTIRIEKVPQKLRKDNSVVFDEVLLVSDEKGKTEIGKPTLKSATVEGTIVRDARAKKVRVVKYKPKVRYKKVTGHRQHFTEVTIKSISA